MLQSTKSDLNSSRNYTNQFVTKMEREILKEYNLYTDLVRLNHFQYYDVAFNTPDTLEHFLNIQTSQQWKTSRLSCEFFFKNFRSCQDKDVYLVLKWLITVHKIISKVANPRLLDEISQNINNMESVTCKQKIEHYIKLKLINPYKQYLQKLCFVKNQSFSLPKSKSICDKENNSDPVSLGFMKINLIKFAVRQFELPCREFLGFFSEFYPFLCQFSKLIHQDIKPLIQEIGKITKSQSISIVPLHQLDNLQTSFDFFIKNDSQFLGTPIKEVKITNFLNSDQRDKSLISSFS